jgi:hypothetical protein
MRLAPNAVVDGRNLDFSDSVSVETDGRLEWRFRVSQTDEFQLFVQTKGSGKASGDASRR